MNARFNLLLRFLESDTATLHFHRAKG